MSNPELQRETRGRAAWLVLRALPRHWSVSALLLLLAILSGVEASSRDRTSGAQVPSQEIVSAGIEVPQPVLGARPAPPKKDAESTVVASFAAIAIEELPLLEEEPRDEDGAGFQGLGELDVTLVTVFKGTLSAGATLSGELSALGISAAVTHRIQDEMRPLFDFRRSQPGHKYRLALDADQNIVDFRYSVSLEESIYLYWDGDSYVVRRDEVELEPRVATLAGRVDGSLYQSIRSQGEDPKLADEFASIFAWDMDFTRNVKSGDEFRLVYERLYAVDDDGEEVYVRPGRIHAARYEGSVGEHSAVYFEPEEGKGSYFRPDGTSVERAFLVAPLRYSRISSTYSNARRHPILNVTRRHPGIDYAAKEGTPLWAVAEGTVIYRGWAGGSGNLIKVRHANGYVSQYAHLSKFAEGLSIGDRVQQKEVIGYVGHTGLATGSHVCFRVTRNGRYVNPLKIRSPAGDSVAAEDQREFGRVRDGLLADLGVYPTTEPAL